MIEKLKLKLEPNEMSARIAKLGLELNDIFLIILCHGKRFCVCKFNETLNYLAKYPA